MIYICLFITCAAIITIAALIRKYSKRYKSAISFRESLDLTGLPVITFSQGKNKFNFLLDTGATNSVINEAQLSNIKHAVIEGAQCEVYGIEGNTQTVPFVEIKFKRDIDYIGNFQVVDLSTAFDAVKAETGVTIIGILGNDFFQNYKYVLDYNTMIAYSTL
jgi:hypothetical protein